MILQPRSHTPGLMEEWERKLNGYPPFVEKFFVGLDESCFRSYRGLILSSSFFSHMRLSPQNRYRKSIKTSTRIFDDLMDGPPPLLYKVHRWNRGNLWQCKFHITGVIFMSTIFRFHDKAVDFHFCTTDLEAFWVHKLLKIRSVQVGY